MVDEKYRQNEGYQKNEESPDVEGFPEMNVPTWGEQIWEKMREERVLPALGMLAGGIVVFIAVFFLLSPLWQGTLFGSETENDEVPDAGEEVDMLPQMTREFTDWNEEFIRDPFESPGKLKGIVAGGPGDNMAIIETSRAAYVVTVGDIIDNYWTVAEIRRNEVLLEAHGEVLRLDIIPRDAPEVVEEPDEEEEVDDPDEEEDDEDNEVEND